MNQNRLALICEISLFVIIAIFAIRPVENFDFWFHVKYGEHIFVRGELPFTDQYSHTAYGQKAIPYEWLFQVILYLIYKQLGNPGVQALVVFLALTYTFLFRQILKEIFQIPLLPRLFLVGFSFVIGYDFWVERPQVAAYVLFMAVLYLVLKRVFLVDSSSSSPRKWGSINKWLLLTIPIFFIWTNLHASMILGLYLFFSFAVVCFFEAYFKKSVILGTNVVRTPESKINDSGQARMTMAARDLFFFGIINTLITLLPPLGIKVYQLLYLFFEKRDFITLVIDEWIPLYELGIRYHIYLLVMILAAISLIWAFLKKTKQNLVYFLPFIPLGLFVISGVRQTQFSMPVILLSLIPAIRLLTPRLKLNITIITVIIIIIFISLITSLYFYRREATGILRLYPRQSIPFIKANLKGNMFNEYGRGGYLMYHLGPDIKTFIDGRTDMFLPKVLPEYDELLNHAYSDREFEDKFTNLVDKYHLSWAIVTTERYTPLRRLARILRNMGWQLVFFDDASEIYVREDNVNDQVIKKYSINAATPFAKRLYKQDQKQQARLEYERMQSLAPSAVSLNALGFLLLEDKKFDQAKNLFEQALILDEKAAAPKMNLAEILAKDGDLKGAIKLYQQAIKDDPARGLAYLRLGQLILASGGSKDQAGKVWQKGLTSTPDEEIITRLKESLIR